MDAGFLRQLGRHVAAVLSGAMVCLAGCALQSSRVAATFREQGGTERRTAGKVATTSGGFTARVTADNSHVSHVEARAQSPGTNVTTPFLVTPTAWVTNTPAATAAAQPTLLPPQYDSLQNPATTPYGLQDPFAAPGGEPLFVQSPPTWHAYTSALGKFGNKRTLGALDVVIPLSQDGQSLLFTDLAARFDDSNNIEGNFGLGWRSIVDPYWIVGVNGFYDLRRTDQDATFQQVGVGVEAMSVLLEARANAYVPLNKSEQVAGPITADVIGNSIYLVGNEQRAYYGADGEIGALLYDGPSGNQELRGFIGGYWFDTNKDNFPTIAGPKGRLEWRCYDLPMLGPDSRLMAGVELQWDDVNDFQVSALARVVIPLGFDHSRRLTRLERRMLDRIVRDDDIVTNVARTPRELGIDSDTGRLLNNVRVVDANSIDIPNIVASADPVNGTIIANGSAGIINTASTIALQEGQVFRGGGFQVIGAETGTSVNFGARPTINGASATDDVLRVANNTIVLGVDITGGQSGITSNDGMGNFANLSNVTIVDNTVTGAAAGGFMFGGIDAASNISGNSSGANGGDGFAFLGSVAGTVSDNLALLNAGSGFRITGNLNGELADNISGGNSGHGVFVGGNVGGTLTGNLALINDLNGIHATTVSGTVADNTASGNLGHGIFVTGAVSGDLSNNSASDNGGSGIDVGSVSGNVANNLMSGNTLHGLFVFGGVTGSVANNSATDNDLDGIHIGGAVAAAGQVAGNTASGNLQNGFRFGSVAGTVADNTASGNQRNGFLFDGDVTGTVAGNNAAGNTGTNVGGLPLDEVGNGFLFNGAISGTISNNTASGNQEDGFDFQSEVSGLVANNVSNNNGQIVGGSGLADGFQFVGNVTGLVSGNQASGNVDDGFFVNGVVNGTFSDNMAQANGGNGFNFANTIAGVISGNTASGSLGTLAGDDFGNGFSFSGDVTGSVSNNLASSNQDDGFDFAANVSGVLANNVSLNNGQVAGGSAFADGFQFLGDMSGTLLGNQAAGNTDDGFFLGGSTTGSITSNVSQANGSDGFVLLNLEGATVFANTATGNASDGFEIGSTADGGIAGNWSSGSLLFNNSTNNALFGYRVNNRTAFPATLSLGNSASGNTDNTVPAP